MCIRDSVAVGPLQKVPQLGALLRGEALEHLPLNDLAPLLPGVQGVPALLGQLHLAAAPVVGGGAAGDKAAPLQAVQHPADGRGVHVAAVGQLPLVAVSQLAQIPQHLGLTGGESHLLEVGPQIVPLGVGGAGQKLSLIHI